jgi:hypothetical protein
VWSTNTLVLRQSRYQSRRPKEKLGALLRAPTRASPAEAGLFLSRENRQHAVVFPSGWWEREAGADPRGEAVERVLRLRGKQ